MNKCFIGNANKVNLFQKTVLVRVDFNVPLAPSLENSDTLVVSNDRRIKGSLQTIKYLVEANAKVVLCSHLGRPKGKITELFSLEPVSRKLKELLVDSNVQFLKDCIGQSTHEAIKNLEGGQIILLENLRFHNGEEKNDPDFASQLAEGIDIYVNDAFGAAHRAHASTVGVTRFVSECYVGFLMKDELQFLGEALDLPKRPLSAVIGGAKVSSKVEVLNNLMMKVDKLLIGGAMVYTFYKAMGFKVGNSLVEDSQIETAQRIMNTANSLKVELILATDSHIIKSNRSQNDLTILAVNNEMIPDGYEAVDVGEKTIQLFSNALENCGTIVWNGTINYHLNLYIIYIGPLGIFESKAYSKGTDEMVKYLSTRTSAGVITVLCGGDTIAALDTCDPEEKYTFSHISTGK